MRKRSKVYRRVFQKRARLIMALKIIGGGFLFSVLAFLIVFFYYAKDLPRPEAFRDKPFVLPTEIYDRDGKVLLYQIFGEEKRTIVPLDRISDNLKNAVMAAEDANFYRHFGLDINGILRSVLKNIGVGHLTYGGSTISQQLIRSSLLSSEKTLGRKAKEVILTLELERRYSKDEILGFYLNQVPFGSNAYGAESASQTYFKKPSSELTLAESALLAALIRAPSRLSPYSGNLQELLQRKDYVLERMAKTKHISQEQSEDAKKEILKFADTRHDIKAPHFVMYVKQYLEENYSDYFIKERGLKVYTSLDWELQDSAEKTLSEAVKQNKKFNAHNAALVAINPRNGQVLALVGSADWWSVDPYPENCTPGLSCQFEPKVNAAMYGLGRQPGSAFKPFAYAAAFQNGLAPETPIWDVPTEFNPDCDASLKQEKDQYGLNCYHPTNYKDIFRGHTTLRNALAQSVNVPSVKVLYLAGLEKTIDLAKKMGITTLDKPASWYGLTLVLGGGEVKLLDMVSAYGVFATEGYAMPPVFILKITDSQGNIIEENLKTPKRVLDIETARTINDVLSDNAARIPMFGVYSPLNFYDRQVAVKTGTTQDYRDAWTIGYAPSIAAGVWAGNNDNSPIDQKPGAMLAAPIWRTFMEKALKKYPSGDFVKPQPRLGVAAEPPEPLPDLDPQSQNWEQAIQTWMASSTAPK